jgi:hypothetical protein
MLGLLLIHHHQELVLMLLEVKVPTGMIANLPCVPSTLAKFLR